MVYSSGDKQFRKKWGSKSEVWSGDAFMTRGHLQVDELCLNARRQVVSKRKSVASKARYDKQGFSKSEIKEESAPVPATTIQEKLALLKEKRRQRYRKQAEG